MSGPDLNLLYTLDALLNEGSVAGAARRLALSPSAMSRALTRLREVTGDPLLVRAGRAMVPTPRALELRQRVHTVVEEGAALLRPAGALDLAALERTFTLRSREGFVENFGAALLARMAAEAPGTRLHFLPKLDKESEPLRSGGVDLETGVVGQATGPELRARLLFRDRFVGVVREGHALAAGEIDAATYAAARHIGIARQGGEKGRIDAALAALGLERRLATQVAGFAAALALARATDLVATVPEKHTGTLRQGLSTFALPFELPPLAISLLWHPRLEADPAHRWLRDLVTAVCAAAR